MALKRIGKDQIARACRRVKVDSDLVRIAQAQLEADQAVIKSLFEEIERLIVPYGWGKIDISRAIRSEDWQALKQKNLKPT